MNQIVILAGGLGTRLRPITEKIPKPLVPVAGKPFLEWQIEFVKKCGFKKILLLVSYLGEQIEEHFGDGQSFGVELQYSFEKEPLGTGGAIALAESFLEEQFIVLNGDSFLPVDLHKFSNWFESSDYSAGMSNYKKLDQVTVPANLKTEGDLVVEYAKGAGQSLGFFAVDSGVYSFRRSLFEGRSGETFSIESLWPGLIEIKGLGSIEMDQRFFDIGTPERLAEFEGVINDYF